jgi:hypothetical protein
MALVHVIKNGEKIDAMHVGTTGSEPRSSWVTGQRS